MATTSELLTEAEAAYHKLVRGESVREVLDQNGERTTYTAASATTLLGYIRSLGGPSWEQNQASPVMRPPMRVFF